MNGTPYTLNSLQPMINQVSPLAYSKIASAQEITHVSTSLLVAGILAYTLSTDTSRFNDTLKVSGTLLMASGLGGMVWGHHRLRAGIEHYNFDLKQKINGSSSSAINSGQNSSYQASGLGVNYSFSF